VSSNIERVDLSQLLFGPTGRWGDFLARVFDLDEDIWDRVDWILRPMVTRPAVHCVAGELDDPDGVLLASINHIDPTVGYIDLLGVRQDCRGRGLARDLVTFVEGVLLESGVETVRWAANPPSYGWPGIDLRYSAGLGAAESLGYRETGLSYEMTVDLADVARRGLFAECLAVAGASEGPVVGERDQRLSDAGIVVLRGSDLTAVADGGPSDVEARLFEWVDNEFGGSWQLEVREALRKARAGHAAEVYVARNQEEFLGFAAYGVWGSRLFGPMGTAPAARGTGIGSRLLRECLADQFVAGQRRSDIGWVGPVSFYSKVVGARISRVYRLSAKQIKPA
jgi:GNAT superfamily N-acetyltransferase